MARNNPLAIQNTHGTVGRSVRTQVQINNSAFTGSGAQGPGDRGGNQVVSMHDSNPYNSNDYVQRWRSYVQLYETSWEARKIIRIPVEDALRKEWSVEGLDDAVVTEINNKLTSMRFTEVLKRSLMLERLLGGCLSFMGLRDTSDEPEKEYKPQQGSELAFINAIPISRISRLSWCTDPLSEHYMRPEAFLINGNEVHVSRCLVWDGEPLFDPYDYALTNFRANLAGFGPSKLAPIWDDIIKAVGSRQAAYQLIQTNNALIMAVQELQDLSGTAPGQKNIQKLEEIARQLSVYRAAMVDGEKVSLSNLAANFGSVPELLMAFLQVLSAASDIPATRFLGQAPGGLNATGESDLENYYNMIDAYQRQRVEPNVRRVYDIIGYHKYHERWATMRKDMKFVFPPLWNTKEGDQADLAGKRIDNALKLYGERAISDEKFIEEINSQGALSVKLDKTDLDLMTEFRDSQDILEAQSNEAFGLGEGAGETREHNPFQPGAAKPVDAKAEIEKLKNMAFDGRLPKTEQFDSDEFWAGMTDEQEHLKEVGGDQNKLADIVRDHLREDPRYYTKLRAAGLMNQEPSASQIAAGNYKKEHLSLHGLDISIENPVGSTRRGTDETGTPWEQQMSHSYGYIKGTTGADKDHIDVFIGPDITCERVVIVDQLNLKTGEFDEHKVMLCFPTQAHAMKAYLDNYDDTGLQRIGTLNPVITVDEFKTWLAEGNTKKPFGNA